MRRAAAVVAMALAAGCGEPTPAYLSLEELMDPASCEACHPTHVREWSGSMHAYAAEDPVFLAMNARGQEDTGGALGDFCVGCHAPVAVRLGLTTDGLNLADVPAWAKGVTCYSCHAVDAIERDHNNGLVLADDGVMRGGIGDPVASPAHRSAYSPLLASDSRESSRTCGSCHDVITPAGAHIERTFVEWQATVFADDGPSHLSCSNCHMNPRVGTAAESPDLDVPLRPAVREHTFASVDVALTPWPELEAQRAAVEENLAPTLMPRICVTPADGGRIDVRLDNVGAGHAFPSGAAHDRRAWAEVIAYDAAGEVLFSSGVVPDDADPEDLGDPRLWGMWERTFDEQGDPAVFFWDVRDADYSELMPAATTLDPLDPAFDHSRTRSYPATGFLQDLDRVTVRVLMRPLPLKLIAALEASGHLSPELAQQVRAALPTHVLRNSVLEWTRAEADAGGCVNP